MSTVITKITILLCQKILKKLTSIAAYRPTIHELSESLKILKSKTKQSVRAKILSLTPQTIWWHKARMMGKPWKIQMNARCLIQLSYWDQVKMANIAIYKIHSQLLDTRDTKLWEIPTWCSPVSLVLRNKKYGKSLHSKWTNSRILETTIVSEF